MKIFREKGNGVVAIAASAGIILLSGCNSVAKMENNTKTLEPTGSISCSFSNDRTFFDLSDMQKEKTQPVEDVSVVVDSLPPIVPIPDVDVVPPLPTGNTGSLLTYKVKKNDTLSHIAVAYKVGIDELAEWNDMNKKDTLFVGKVLKMPPGAVKPHGPVRSALHRRANVRYYVVKKGDTLGHIAIREKVSVADIKKWNHLKSDRIYAGKKLALGKGGKKSRSTNPKRAAIPRNGIHVVKLNQSLSTIAYRYGMSVSELKRLNGLTTNHIVPGQKLYLRSGIARNRASSARSWINSSPARLENGNKYTVKKGDILGRIANKFGVTVQRIMRANGLSNMLIRKGQVLVIPTAGPGRARALSDTPAIVTHARRPVTSVATTNVANANVNVDVNTTKFIKLPHFVDQQNDTLEMVATMYDSKIEWIIAANPGITSTADLRSVKEITVPVEDLAVK